MSAAAPVPICESSKRTVLFSALSNEVVKISGSETWYRSGSPVLVSLWMRTLPTGTSRTTRLRPFSSEAPERRIETPQRWPSGTSSSAPA